LPNFGLNIKRQCLIYTEAAVGMADDNLMELAEEIKMMLAEQSL
jgi:hypothetical protein